MNHTGLLFLTAPLKSALESLGSHLNVTSKHVYKKLYVLVEPKESYLKAMSRFIPVFYDKASTNCKNIDVRLLLQKDKLKTHDRPSEIQVILTDSTASEANITNVVNKQFRDTCSNIVRLESLGNEDLDINEDLKTYNYVVLGGTFDRLHNGHKILLSAAVLRAKKKLVIGVTDGIMLKHKSYWELIEPIEKRVDNLLEYLNDIDPTIEYSTVPIYDPFGPAIVQPELECIIVSNETKRGGILVNEERRKRDMNDLDMVIIDLVSNPDPGICDEAKMSSSNQRRSLLGKYLRKPPLTQTNSRMLSIALIGGSYKDSCLTSHLENLGALIVSCNQLINEFLKEGSKIREKTIEKFGKEMVEVTSTSFNKIGQVYLLSSSTLEKEKLQCYVTQIVEYLCEYEMESLDQNSEGSSICILKLPPFIKTSYLKKVDQIWGILIPENDRLENIKSTLSVDESEAMKILSEENTNSDIVSLSHLVLSPHNDSIFVAKQVNTAWEQLKSHQSKLKNLPKSSM